jgi:hypothetical protein
MRPVPELSDREFEPARIIWLAPLTIISAVAAVRATRWLATVELLTRLA